MKKRVVRAAELRGIHFDGVKKFRNPTVGVAYECFTPNGRGIISADTLGGMYKSIMQYPVIPRRRRTEKERYSDGKSAARDKAMDFLSGFGEHAEHEGISWGELAAKQEEFNKLARRYGLVKEFRENGVI